LVNQVVIEKGLLKGAQGPFTMGASPYRLPTGSLRHVRQRPLRKEF